MSEEITKIKKTNYPNIILKVLWVVFSIFVVYSEVIQILGAIVNKQSNNFITSAVQFQMWVRIPVIIITLFSILLMNRIINSKKNKLSKKIILFFINFIIILSLWSLSFWIFSTMCGNCSGVY